MATHNLLGKAGEDAVAEYLKKKATTSSTATGGRII